MTAKRTAALLAIVLGLLAAVAAPLGAQSLSEAREQREEARRRQAALASKLDTLEASDNELEAAVAALNAHLATASAKADAARQAAEAAEAELAAARAHLEATRQRITTIRGQLRERAVQAYIHPRADFLSELLGSADIEEATRRQVFLENVASNENELLDELGAAKEDLQIEEAAASAAAQRAAERRAEADSRVADARRARDEQLRLKLALDARIAEFRAEADQLDAAEAQLAAVIAEQEAQMRASRGSSATPDGRISAAGLIWPTRGSVTSEYGYRWGRMHEGIDIAAPTGTPIWAAADGVVIYSGVMNGYGLVILIDHGGGFTTVYAHQSRLAAGDGRRVSQGELIGYVGSTGHSTGPHLHFETRVNGSAQNPRNYLP